MAKTGGLSDSSDNMAEVAEFLLGTQSFGINGSKIKQIVQYEEGNVTYPPFNHPSVVGVYLFRGHTVPLIELNAYLSMPKSKDLERRVVVVTEFNEITTAFIADKVNRIHRLSWAELNPLNSYLAEQSPQIIGTISIEDREILVLDLEQIIGEIFPSTVVNYDAATFTDTLPLQRREEVKVFFAEDSHIIRTQLTKVLHQVGYADITPFSNGAEALEGIQKAVREAEETGGKLSDYVDLLITDIEMPQMDGLVLCQTVKKQMKLDLPVLIFSSLINEQVSAKCEAAGCDASVSKPQTEKVIALMDQLSGG